MTTITTTARPDATSMPTPALVLGAAGVLPFLALAVAPAFDLAPFGRPPLEVLALYAAIILSFMGAVHWGLAMARIGGNRDHTWQYVMSVLPALVGWFALAFLPLGAAFVILAITFGLLLVYDLRAIRLQRAPVWYARLRWPLTLIVVPSLLWASILA
jgi:Protein of unknown function (DUF3429)